MTNELRERIRRYRLAECRNCDFYKTYLEEKMLGLKKADCCDRNQTIDCMKKNEKKLPYVA